MKQAQLLMLCPTLILLQERTPLMGEVRREGVEV